MVDWTTAADIKRQTERYWHSGRLLASRIANEPLFPLQLNFKKPDSRALSVQFHEVRQWIRELESQSNSERGIGYEIEWGTVNHRQLGANRVPVRVVLRTEADALRLIGKESEAERFYSLALKTIGRFPALEGWLIRRPLAVLEHAGEWEAILIVLGWFCDHPLSELYLRQIDIPGIDTKFIEARKGLLAELFEVIAPVEGALSVNKPQPFEQRFGLRSKPPLIRFRILDERLRLHGLSDLSVPATEFARLRLAVQRVFITENDINGLAFPNSTGSLVIFGLGYGLDRLSEAEWLRERPIHYWGDIDTHGFAILDRLRALFPICLSFLMDRETLMAHRQLWVREDQPFEGDLNRLSGSEQALYNDLRYGVMGEGVRLEQERIPFGWLRNALDALG